VFSTSLNVNYTYNPGPQTGVLTSTGQMYLTTATVQLDEADTGSTGFGTFELQVELESDGQILEGGDHELHVAWDPYMTGNIDLFYSTTLIAFGFSADDKFECIFEQEGNMLAPDKEQVGVILWGVSIGGGEPVFNAPFSNGGNGYSDTFYLPEPSGLVVLSIVGLGALYRRKRGNR